MEGVDLHPWVDERGVHRFDPNEVEALASGESNSCSAPQIGEAQATSDAATNALNAANARVSELERRCAALEADVERLTASAQREQRQVSELRGTAIEALGMVETLLGPDTPYAVRSVLRDLRRAS